MLTDIIALITRLVVAVEKLADAQMLIATEDGPVPADRTRAPQNVDPDEAAGEAAGASAARREEQEAPAPVEREIGPVEVREALTAVTQHGPEGKAQARKILASFKGMDGKPVKKVSHIPAESLVEVHAALVKAIV